MEGWKIKNQEGGKEGREGRSDGGKREEKKAQKKMGWSWWCPTCILMMELMLPHLHFLSSPTCRMRHEKLCWGKVPDPSCPPSGDLHCIPLLPATLCILVAYPNLKISWLHLERIQMFCFLVCCYRMKCGQEDLWADPSLGTWALAKLVEISILRLTSRPWHW